MIEVIKIVKVLPVIVVVICTMVSNTFAEKYQIDDTWRIVISESASPSEKYAASELQKFLKEISVTKLPIITDKEPISQHEIILGDNAHLWEFGVKIDFEKLGIEGCTIRTAGNNLIIAGSKKRGTLYGVYTFLDKYLGCRWFTGCPKEINRIPKVGKIEFDDIDYTQIPALKYRHISPWCNSYLGARNKLNKDIYPYGPGAPMPEELGGSFIEFEGHTFYTFVPPQKYFKEHPEYYSEIDGKRVIKNPVTGETAELCLTNPDVLRIATENVRNIFLQHPEIDIISVAQMDDSGTYCRCVNCRAIDEREGTPMGSILTFVNKIAEEIEKEFPDKSISTFAYTYSVQPPKTIKPRKNVIIDFAPITACFSHPMEECEKNARFKEIIEGWHKLGAKIHILDYAAQYRHYLWSFTNLGVLKKNVQFYVKNGVVGIMSKGDVATSEGLLRAYLLSRLFVDPDCDIDMAKNEFLEAYYGKAAGLIRQYLDMLIGKINKDNLHFGSGAQPNRAGGDGVSVPFNTLFTPEIISKAEKLFDDAEKLVAGDSEKLLHVQKTRLGIWYFQIHTMSPDDPKRTEVIVKFLNVLDKCPEVNMISEGTPWETFKKKLKLEIGLEKPSATLRSDTITAGDFDGDGSSEIVGISADGTSIMVFDYTLGAGSPVDWLGWKFNNIAGIGYATRGDNFVSVATGDLDGDGKDEIVATGGKGGVPASGICILKYTPGKAGPDDWSGWKFSNITGVGYVTRHDNFVNITTGDVDGDGKDEIVATGGKDGVPASGISILKYTPGKEGPPDWSGWKFSNITGVGFVMRGDNFADIATGDVDGDGKDEIIASGGEGGTPASGICVLKYTPGKGGPPIWGGWTWDNITGVGFVIRGDNFVNVTAGDVDGDGKAEVIATGGKGAVPASGVSILKYTPDAGGPAEWSGWTWSNITGIGWAARPEGESFHGIRTGDTDGDGKAEVIVIGKTGDSGDVGIYKYESGKGAPWSSWAGSNITVLGNATRPTGESFDCVTTGDADGDKMADIVVSGKAGESEDIGIYKYTPDKGAPRDGWSGSNITILGEGVKPKGEPSK